MSVHCMEKSPNPKVCQELTFPTNSLDAQYILALLSSFKIFTFTVAFYVSVFVYKVFIKRKYIFLYFALKSPH